MRVASRLFLLSLVSFLLPNRDRSGDVTVPPLAEVKEDLSVPGRLVVGDGAILHGKVEVAGEARLGRRVRVKGPLHALGTLRVGRGSTFEKGFQATSGVHFEGDATVGAGSGTEPAPKLPQAPPAPPPAPERKVVLKDLTVDVPTEHADELLAAFRAVGWHAEDSGRTVATDEDEESLTTLHLDVLLPAKYAHVEIPHHPRAPVPAPHPVAPPPSLPPAALRGVVYASGDLYVGEGVEMDVPLSASGRIIVGPGASIQSLVRAKADLILAEDAVVGDAICGGTLTLEEGARVANLMEAEGGIEGPGVREIEPPATAPHLNRGHAEIG